MSIESLNGGMSPEEAELYAEIQKEEKSFGTEQKVIEIVKRDVDYGRRFSESEQSLRTKYYNLYRANGDGRKEREGRSRVACSDIMDTIEWMMPSLMDTFAGSYEAVVVSPVGTEDVGKAEKLQRLINWQLMNTETCGFNTIYQWIKSALIYGTAVVKVTWCDKYKKKNFDIPIAGQNEISQIMQDDEYFNVSATPEDIQPGQVISQDVLNYAADKPDMLAKIGSVNSEGMQIQPYAIAPFRVYRDINGVKKIKTFSGPLVEVVAPEDFFIDPNATSVEKAQFVVHRVWRTFGELKKLEEDGIYRNVDNLKAYFNRDYEHSHNAETSERYAAAGQTNPKTFDNISNTDEQISRKRLEVFEWWGSLDLANDGIEEKYLVVVCGDQILRMEKNPYAHEQPPFEVLRPMLDPFKFTGVGVPEMLGEFQEIKTAIMRQMLDNVSFQNNGMWLVNRNAGVDMNALLNPRPGGVVRTNLVAGAVTPITPSSLQSMPIHTIELLDSMMQKRSGMTAYNQGTDANTLNKTASGLSRIMDASKQRLNLIKRIMSETGIRPLYQKILSLNQQFVDQTIVIRVFKEPIEITPDDLAGEFDVSIDIGKAASNGGERVQQLMLLMQYAAQLMSVGTMRPDNIYQVVKKILEIWDWKDYERYLSDPQEAQQLQQILALIQQFGQRLQSGQPPMPQEIVAAFQQIYQTVQSVLGSSQSEGMKQTGTPSNALVNGAVGGDALGGYNANAAAGANLGGTNRPEVRV